MITRDESYVPQMLLTVFVEKEERKKVYVEKTTLSADGQPGESSPLSLETANALGKALYQTAIKQVSGIIPPNLLHLRWLHEKPVLTWFTPAGKVKAWYTAALKIPDGIIHVPPLIWHWQDSGQHLYLYAMDTDERPGEETELCHAPFHNVYDSGSVCLGTGARHIKKKETFITMMSTVMHVFWNTKFSETHNEQAVKGNLNSLHHELVTTGRPFPMDRLIKTKRTLNQINNETI